MTASGCPQERRACAEPRAWVIRMPGSVFRHADKTEETAFQTIVVAEDAESAWEVACVTDEWEVLPFQVKKVQIFPRDIPGD